MTSLWCTFVNPFLVVHLTHILVHRAHLLKSAGLDVNDTCKRPISLWKHLYLILSRQIVSRPQTYILQPQMGSWAIVWAALP